MVFRTAPRAYRTGKIVYGPFPIRAHRLFLALASLLFMVPPLFAAFDDRTLACMGDGSCSVTERSIAGVTTVPIASLRDARVEHETGSKGAKLTVVVLLSGPDAADASGQGLRFLYAEESRAEDVAAAVRAGIARRQPFVVTIRGSRWCVLVAFGILAIVIAMASFELRRGGRFHLDVRRGGAALRVSRRILGLPFGAREVSLEAVTDVVVETGVLTERWRGQSTVAGVTGRITLVDRAGARRPMTEAMFSGEAVHLRAASELRALLKLEPRRGGVEDRLAALPDKTTPLGTRLGFAWAGVTVGGLVGFALFGGVGIALGLVNPKEAPAGWGFGVGGGGGAIAGAALVFYLTRPRPPR